MKRNKLTPEAAQWLLEALSEVDFFSEVCECGRTLREHTTTELKECTDKLINGDD